MLRKTFRFPSYQCMNLPLLCRSASRLSSEVKLSCVPRFAIVQIMFLLQFIAIITTSRAETIPLQAVHWYYNDFPPYFITSGSYQGMGSGDQQMKILIQRLPQFRHERVLASHSRAVEMMKGQTNVCHTALFKTPERAAEMEYSVPILQNLSNGFITLRTRFNQLKPFLDEQGQLRLNDFLNDGTYRVGIVAGRSFGAGVDGVLKKHLGQKSVVVVTSNDGLASRLLKLITQREYDAVISYSYELQYVVRHLKLNPRDFVFIPIVEQVPLQPIYVACSKSEFGKQVIAAINLALSDSSTKHDIESAYRFWLDEESAARWDRLRVQSH
jgi:uncharacterized protein (TIGR02285 family)